MIRLRERLGGRVEVVLHDERFTTRMAERFGGEGDEDSRAAAHLLEGWLAAQGSPERSHGPRPGLSVA